MQDIELPYSYMFSEEYIKRFSSDVWSISTK